MSREQETIRNAIDFLEAYRMDLDWWEAQGHDHWMSCGNGTPDFSEEKKPEAAMTNYLNEVTDTIKRLEEIKP